MPTDPMMIRASDQDRDRTAELLREHHAVGRLDAEEFQERLDKVYTAKTIGDLEELTEDLPAVDPYPLPAASLPKYRPPGGGGPPASSIIGLLGRGHGRFSPAWQAAWGSWFCLAAVCSAIWVATGAGFPWPLWVAGPCAAILAGRWAIGSGPGGRAGRRRGRIGHHHEELGGSPDDGTQGA